MTIITPGDPASAPYRRLWVLRNIAGIAYESPTKKTIHTTLADIVGSDPITLGQVGNILTQLQQRKLAQFTTPDINALGHRAFNEPMQINNLDQSLLAKLTREAEAFIAKRDNPTGRSKARSVTPTKKPRTVKPGNVRNVQPPVKATFGDRHPVLRDTYTAVAAALIVAAILAAVPSTRTYISKHFINRTAQAHPTRR